MVELRSFSSEERQKLADKGYALPDGSFPIVTVQDLHNAIQAMGRASNPEAAKRHIIKRAKALGATSQLPDDWKVEASGTTYLRYGGVSDLPPAVKDAYSPKCQAVFMRVFNAAFYAKKPEEQAFALAHTAAKACSERKD